MNRLLVGIRRGLFSQCTMLFCTVASVSSKKTGPMWYGTDTTLIDTMVVFTLMAKASVMLEIGTML